MLDETKIEHKNKSNKKSLIGAVAVIIIVLVVVITVFVPKAANAKKAAEQLSLGEKYLSELKYEQAEAAYLAVIEIDPKNVDAYLGLADVYVAQGEYDRAVEVLEKALEKIEEENIEMVRKKFDEVYATKEVAEITPAVAPTSTPTPVPTATSIPTPEPTATSTPTPTPTSTPPPTNTPPPSPTPTNTPTPIPEWDRIIDVELEIGDSILFGRYEQDGITENGVEPIEWIVLDKLEDRALLLSKDSLEKGAYHAENAEVTWENCTLRQWLNIKFYQESFSDSEKRDIASDYVFLLSEEEAERYFPDVDSELIYQENPARVAVGTLKLCGEESGWWLRTMVTEDRASAINSKGGIVAHGISVEEEIYYAVRPAIWLMLERTITPTPTPTPTNTPTPTPTNTPTPTPVQIIEMDKTMYVKSGVNVRSGPSTSYEKIGSLETGEQVHVTGYYEQKGWYRIDYKNKVGHVSKNYLQDTPVLTASQKEMSTLEELLNRAPLTPKKSGYAPLDASVERLLNEITTDEMTTYQKVKTCYDYFINTFSRGTNEKVNEAGFWDEWYYYYEVKAWGIIEGHIGGCSDYSPAFAALMQAIGLNCYIVDGDTSAAAGGYTYHVWCEMVLEGEIYVFDPQVEDNIAKGGTIKYYRFGKKYEQVPEKYIKTVQEYDENGRLVKQSQIKYLSTGPVESYIICEYDSFGNHVKESYYNTSGELESYWVYEYDASGSAVGAAQYRADGTLIW